MSQHAGIGGAFREALRSRGESAWMAHPAPDRVEGGLTAPLNVTRTPAPKAQAATQHGITRAAATKTVIIAIVSLIVVGAIIIIILKPWEKNNEDHKGDPGGKPSGAERRADLILSELTELMDQTGSEAEEFYLAEALQNQGLHGQEALRWAKEQVAQESAPAAPLPAPKPAVPSDVEGHTFVLAPDGTFVQTNYSAAPSNADRI